MIPKPARETGLRDAGLGGGRPVWGLGAAVLLAGVLTRGLLCYVVVPEWESRSNIAAAPDHYSVLARSLLDRGVLGFEPIGASPTTARGPGFPVWLALGILLGGDGEAWLGFWGGLPGLIVGAGIAAWLAGRYGRVPGAVAGAVACLHPLPSVISARGLGDDFYGALGFAGLALWCVALSERAAPRAVTWATLSGGILAAQMLTRSSGLLTLVAAAAVGAFRRPRRPGLLIVLLIVSLGPPLAWSIRTSRLEGRPVFVQSLLAYNFWLGEGFDRFGHGWTDRRSWGKVLELVLDTADVPEEQRRGFWYGGLTPPELAVLEADLSRAAVRRIVEDPSGYAGRVARGCYRFWFQAQTGARTLQYVALVAPVLLLALVGAISALRARDPSPFVPLLVWTILLHNLAYAAVMASARMSVQVYPAVAFLSGIGAARVLGTLCFSATRLTEKQSVP